jgi:hypothetical protein
MLFSICPKDFGDQHIDMTLGYELADRHVVIIVAHSATDPASARQA